MGRLGSNMIEILSISEGGPGSPEIVSSVAKFAVTFAHGVATPCSKAGALKATVPKRALWKHLFLDFRPKKEPRALIPFNLQFGLRVTTCCLLALVLLGIVVADANPKLELQLLCLQVFTT